MSTTTRPRSQALSVDEFAGIHNVSRDTVIRHIADGSIEAYKVGVQWRIRADVAHAISHPCGGD